MTARFRRPRAYRPENARVTTVSVNRGFCKAARCTGLVVAWSGMRGIVTLAAALALPDGSGAGGFPYRDLIILCAFCVVLSTLVIQGLTLRPLLGALGLKDSDPSGLLDAADAWHDLGDVEGVKSLPEPVTLAEHD